MYIHVTYNVRVRHSASACGIAVHCYIIHVHCTRDSYKKSNVETVMKGRKMTRIEALLLRKMTSNVFDVPSLSCHANVTTSQRNVNHSEKRVTNFKDENFFVVGMYSK